MHNDVDAVAVRPNTKDLPSKNRVWGFRVPARQRIRKAAAQAAETRRENRSIPTNIASGIRYFLLTDQVGTLRAVADTSGNIVKRIDYDSFGNIIADSNPSFTVPFGFAGGLHDRDTGLVRFGFRDYSPELGRFVAKDPIDFAGGDTNLYAYVMNDPVNFVDPEGDVRQGITRPEAHPGAPRHVHWGDEPKCRNGGGVYEDGTLRDGDKKPPNKIVDLIRKIPGFTLENLRGIQPLIVLPDVYYETLPWRGNPI